MWLVSSMLHKFMNIKKRFFKVTIYRKKEVKFRASNKEQALQYYTGFSTTKISVIVDFIHRMPKKLVFDAIICVQHELVEIQA